MKLILTVCSGLLFTTTLLAQLPVSQTATNKSFVLEELTGIHCQYCPDGHKIANQIKAANPTRVVLVNIHSGGYAAPSAGEPDFRTANGTALDAFFNPSGYPAGSAQRRDSDSDGKIAIGRGSWTSIANTVLAETSPLNMAMEATIDASTRVVTINVQMFYTTPYAGGTTHKLNIGILQNNVESAQSGSSYNPSAILPNGNYLHQHIFRGFVNANGNAGVAIDASTVGVITETVTYTLPASINGVPLEIGDLEFFAFVGPGMNTASTSAIITGTEVVPTYTNVPPATASLNSILGTYNVCSGQTISPVVKVTNTGEAITSLDFSSSINGGTPTVYNWTGNIPDFGSAEITLPAMAFTPIGTNNLQVTITAVNGGTGNVGSTAVQTKPITIGTLAINNNVTVKMTTDRYGSEITWKIFNSTGTQVGAGGPYTDAAASGAFPQADVVLNLPNNDCYKAVVYDSYGDGFDSGYGNGNFDVTSLGNIVMNVATFNTSEASDVAKMQATAGLNDLANEIGLSIYPNPASTLLNVEFNANNSDYSIEVLDLTGRSLSLNTYSKLNGNQNIKLSVADLNTGNYIIKITTNGVSSIQKFVVL